MSFSVHYDERRYTVKAAPMQKLQVLVDQLQAQLRPPPAHFDGQLLVNGVAADLSMPVRFANLPSNAKLEVQSGLASRLGIREEAEASTRPSPAADAGMQKRNVQESAAQSPQTQARNSYTDGSAADGPAEASSSLSSGRQASRGGAREAGFDLGVIRQSQTDVPSNVAALALDREVSVFTRAGLQAAAPSTSSEDPPDSFFEFGADDFAAVMRGYNRSKAEAEKGLRTGKMREQEQQDKARKYPNATLRVQFPDGYLLQMSFKSLEKLAAVRKSVQMCLLTQVAQQSWDLYVTPPKQILRDDSLTIFQAGLCPAAKLYFSSALSGPFLRPDIAALVTVPEGASAHPSEAAAGELKEDAQQQQVLEQPLTAKREARDKTVPKWLKLANK